MAPKEISDERHRPSVWKNYTFALIATGIGRGYMYLGDWMVATGRMGETPHLIGDFVGFLLIAAAFAVALSTTVAYWREEHQETQT